MEGVITTIPLVIPAQAGIQFCVPQNLCHLATLHRLILRINWIPRVRGMTTARHSAPLGRGTRRVEGVNKNHPVASRHPSAGGELTHHTTQPDGFVPHPLFRSGVLPCAALLTILLCKIYS